MFKVKPSRWVGLMAIVVLSGCAYAPPIQEMSDARQSARAAIDAGADHYLPTIMERIDDQLAEAEERLAVVDYQGAKQQALEAKSEAVRARTMVLKLTSTIETVAQAERIAQLKPDTHAVLQQALDAASRGNDTVAMVLVEKARQEAESALEGYDLERAQLLMAELKRRPEHLRSSALSEALVAAEVAIQLHEGHRAYDLLAPYATTH
jgi:hypothetical protein